MRLDPEKCPIGTVGYLPPGSAGEFVNEKDFGWFKEPSVVLGDDRKWHPINPSPIADTFPSDESTSETIVFATWKSAVRHMLEKERATAQWSIDEARKEIAEYEKTIEQANAVEKWLNEAE